MVEIYKTIPKQYQSQTRQMELFLYITLYIVAIEVQIADELVLSFFGQTFLKCLISQLICQLGGLV